MMACMAIGCKKNRTGRIDFILKQGNEDYPVRMWFCPEHYKELENEIERLIKIDHDTGRLEKKHFYAFVPWHITKVVLHLEGLKK